MKRLILKTTLLIFISIVFMDIIMLFGQDGYCLHSHEKNAILAYNRLEGLKDTNKIVIFAGSNGQFSINSRMIHKSFNIPVVNTSFHAGMGIRMQFELYKDLLRKGDVVILCPEYGSGFDKGRLYGETTLLRVLSTYMPSAYKKVSFSQWVHLYKYFGIRYIGYLDRRTSNKFDGPYSANAVNEYGDIECESKQVDSIKDKNGTIKGEVDNAVLEYIKYIHDFTKAKGIKLVFLPPTFIESDYKMNLKQIDSIANTLKQNGIAWQAKPSRYSFPDSLYYDTPYHMTQEGANKRTEVLIEDLRRVLNNKN